MAPFLVVDPGLNIRIALLGHIRADDELRLTASPEAGGASERDTFAVPRRILVVDDHPGFRRQVRLMLEEAGYDVVAEAADAAGAITAAGLSSPDIALVDIGLPDRDGFIVAQALTSGGAAPAVVLVSGRDASHYGPRVAACGARGFVAKVDLTAGSLEAVLGRRG